MIDLQRIRGGEGDYQRRRAEIQAEWEAAGVIVLDPPGAEGLPESVRGVPRDAIYRRLRGGAGGGIEQEAVQVFTNLWPLVAAGFVGAVSADAWNYTKKRLAAALKRLLGSKVQQVTIEVADENDGFRDDTYLFDAGDAGDIDRAVEAMAANSLARGALAERQTIAYRWDSSSGKWLPVSGPRKLRQ